MHCRLLVFIALSAAGVCAQPHRYAEKILGATQLALHDSAGAPERKQESIAHLKAALSH
jgi:hypothetical protein